MIPLNFQKVVRINLEINGPGVDTFAARDLMATARQNKLEVLDAALMVEGLLGDAITVFFFSDESPNRKLFQADIMNSTWCMFESKRKLVGRILESSPRFKDDEIIKRSDFLTLLNAVIRYRNAFAHGHFSTDGKSVWLEYSYNGIRKDELTDEYLHELRTTIISAQDQVDKLFGMVNSPV